MKPTTVLVTGAASGIGRCIVDALLERGDRVFACDMNASALGAFEGREGIKSIVMDVTKQADIDAAVKTVRELGWSIDAIVNNAGIALGGPLVEMPDSVMAKQFDVNVFGVFRVTKAFFPLLHESRGRVVIMGSVSGKFTAPFVGPYSMSKRAMEGYADALRRELDPLGMHVSLVVPGDVKTPIWDKARGMMAEMGPSISPLFCERALKIVGFGITKAVNAGLEPTDVARKVVEAIHAPKPKPRYPINKSRLMAWLMTRLPDRIIDAIVRKM
ncbi:MAG: SDR family oxidoreductase [Candidatus Lokiarchaeota archaeon]|nr:SDR family oxidoreductase [Candidatus Lokiarchaeota archaeon]